MYNESLTNSAPQAYEQITRLRKRFERRVMEIMGWKTNHLFLDRVYGRAPLTEAEYNAFRQAYEETMLPQTDELFPPIKSAATAA